MVLNIQLEKITELNLKKSCKSSHKSQKLLTLGSSVSIDIGWKNFYEEIFSIIFLMPYTSKKMYIFELNSIN